MKKLLLSYVKLGSRREVSRSRSNVMAVCGRTDTANSQETYAGREVTKSCAVSNFVSADRIQVDRMRYCGTAYLPTIQGFPGLSRDLGSDPGIQGFLQ